MRYKENWISFYTLLRREYVRILRIWPQTLLPPVITTGLYFVIFGGVIGSRIGAMGGISYMQYIVPGLIMMAIINNAYINVVFSFYSNKFQRNLEEMFVAPMPNYAILCGYVCGGVMRSILVGLLVAVLAMFFTDITVYSWGLTIFIGLLTAFLLSIAGFINGVFANKFDDLSIVPMFVLTPLTYLGGVFYSIDLLPATWQKITHYNPIFYMIAGFRYAILGQADVALEYTIFILLSGSAVLFVFSLWLLNKGIGVKT